MLKFFLDVIKYNQVLKQLIHQQITMRYRRTIFGFFWTLLNPLLNMAIISAVFSLVMRFQIHEYAIFLFSAMIPWAIFSTSLSQSATALITNEQLFKKIFLPKQLFVLSAVISTIIDSILSTACLFVIALIIGAKLTTALLFLPLAFVLLGLFTLGLSLFLSIVTVYYRDIQYLVGVVLQALYFATPIIYPIDSIPEQYHSIFTWNPMYYFVKLFRDPIYSGVFPDRGTLLICGLSSVIVLILGVLFFNKNDKKVIFRL